MGFYFSYILLIFYILGLALFVKKYSFFTSSKLSKNNIVFLAILKMIAGILYVCLTAYQTNGGDVFEYFKDGNLIYDQLSVKPSNYFKLTFFPNNVAIPLGTETVIKEMGFWGDTGAYMLVRFNALVRLFSLGNIYIHSLFAGFLSFVGSFHLLKVFETQFKTSKIILYSIFLSPSLFFWTAGIHKEFISILALGFILYNFFKLVEQFNKAKNILIFSIGILLFFYTRNYMLLALIPSIIAFSIHKVFHVRFQRAVYFSLLVLIGFLNFQKIPSYSKTGFEVIVEKRSQFEDLKTGNTSIELAPIEPTFISLMKNSPKALFNAIARPHFGDVKSFFLALASIESFIISLLFVMAFFNFHKLNFNESNLVLFMLIYAFSLLLIIGWIVPNLGAIVRYRSISLIILIPTLLHVVLKNEKIKSLIRFFT